IDGPTAALHNEIRGVEAFEHILRGIRSVIASPMRPIVSIRSVVQKKNFRVMSDMVELARSLHVDRISFLAADISSRAFNRENAGKIEHQPNIVLSKSETIEFRKLMEEFIARYGAEIRDGFIAENVQKLMHLAEYFEALSGTRPFPRNLCNAPMVSTVITSTGDVLPCYFLPPVGNIRTANIETLLNSNIMQQTRKSVRAYSLQRCQECVCTLYVSPTKAFMDAF
ncbi:MAG: SPASM domain-containing protein, partial [Nitrososphaera sp.]|nr:SPASM domain-containing protein [Nitrososphaera sp.]